jgi:hypothetical protein
MKRYKLLILIVVFTSSTCVAFSLGVILAKPASGVVAGSGSVCSQEHKPCVRLDTDGLDGLVRWRNEPNRLSLKFPIEWSDGRGGHAASGW